MERSGFFGNFAIKGYYLLSPSNGIRFQLTMNMSFPKIAGVILLGMLWIWLSIGLFNSAGGFTLKNLFIVAASGIIIFVPLWKKYKRL